MALAQGQSELDTVVLRLPNTSTEIQRFEHYRVTSRYLTPCDQFEFTLGDEDLDAALEALVPGTPVEIAVNDRLVMTGAIDNRTIASSRHGGTVLHVVGRDILGAVVSSNVDPSFKFSESLSVLDVAAAVLAPFGIATIYNDGSLNVNVMTGRGQKGKPASESASVQLPKLELADDGTITTTYATVSVSQVGNKESLKTLKLQQIKPHFGEGAYEYLERIVSRFGMHAFASADGSGVVIDEPDFTSPAQYAVKRSRVSADSNVEQGHVELDLDSQPSCIFAQGVQSGLFSEPKSTLQVIMVNELVGTDESGRPLPEVQNVIARYKGAKVLPLRSELVPTRKAFNDRLIARPMFLKDDESRSIAQLELFVRRKMAERQHKALTAKYTISGHTQRDVPWSVDTMVSVQDEVAGVAENLWILERTFEKSRHGGTTTTITCVRPFTLELGKARNKGSGSSGKSSVI